MAALVPLQANARATVTLPLSANAEVWASAAHALHLANAMAVAWITCPANAQVWKLGIVPVRNRVNAMEFAIHHPPQSLRLKQRIFVAWLVAEPAQAP